ncbi:hypothetical protein MMC27_002648 [Xylographa pallens]|nr:hypothetical protein [Xylographa pallens]
MTTPQRIPLPPTGTLTPPLRSQLNAALLATTAIPTIHSTLLHECQASGWLDLIKARVLDLLRSGECATYGEVMAVVLQEMKGNSSGRGDGGGAFAGGGVKRENENNNNGAGGVNGVNGVNGGGEGASLRVPERVVEVGVRVVRGFLDEVVDIEGEEEGG